MPDTLLVTGPNFQQVLASTILLSRGDPVYLNPFGKVWFVSTAGNDGGDGTVYSPFRTLGHAFAVIASGDTIWLTGNHTANLTTPTGVSNVTIIGAGPATRPARWSGTNGLTAALCSVTNSGWRFVNMKLQAPTDAAAIEIVRTASLAGHDTMVLNCEFNGGAIGVQSNGGASHCLIVGNWFHDVTSGTAPGGTSGALISTSQAQASPLDWQIAENNFTNNANHVILPGNDCVVRGNIFQDVGASIDSTAILNTSGGNHGHNMVFGNCFSGTYTNGGGYTCGTADTWANNWLTGGVTSALPAP